MNRKHENVHVGGIQTWSCHRAVLIARTPDTQLAIAVPAPALDTAPSHDDARMSSTRCYGDCRDT